MAWRRHTRNLSKEVFYNGTTIDGSRLDKAVAEVAEGINNAKKGDTKQRFVATQYHAGFNPLNRASTNLWHTFPFLRCRNNAGTTAGEMPTDSTSGYNRLRFKGTAIPGIDHGIDVGLGKQYAWTRTFHFSKPAILYGVSVLMHVDGGVNTENPCSGTYNLGTVDPYTYDTRSPGSGEPPEGFADRASTIDVPIVLDVMNPGTPEDAVMTDVEYTRTRWVINEELTSLTAPNASSSNWDDFNPPFDSGNITTVRPLSGRIVEHRDLNIPIHEYARVRLAVLLPECDGTVYTQGSWGDKPWYLQGWSVTLTVLEEVQTL